MAAPGQEIINGVLYVTGTLDRSADQDFQKVLEKYAEITPAAERLVDMSNVRWLAPAGAKALIAAAQEANEKGGKLRVLASRHVMQTLNLLGAKNWLTIETCLTPNPRPGSEPAIAAVPVASTATPQAAETVEQFEVQDQSPLQQEISQITQHAPETIPAPSSSPMLMPISSDQSFTASDSARLAAIAEAAKPPPRKKAGASSQMLPAIVNTGPLAGPAEELSRGGTLLRVLYANRRYNFHFPGGQSVLGVVRERAGGSWVLVETTSTRKFVNLDSVQFCELL